LQIGLIGAVTLFADEMSLPTNKVAAGYCKKHVALSHATQEGTESIDKILLTGAIELGFKG